MLDDTRWLSKASTNVRLMIGKNKTPVVDPGFDDALVSPNLRGLSHKMEAVSLILMNPR